MQPQFAEREDLPFNSNIDLPTDIFSMLADVVNVLKFRGVASSCTPSSHTPAYSC